MTESPKRRLIALGANPYFSEGTLFEIVGATLPDRGDGEPVEADQAAVVECQPFAENVPPGQCPVQITSFRPGSVDDVRLDQTIHWQKLEVPIAPSLISSIDVLDRSGGFEADHYESPSGEDEANYGLHIGHLRPGSYEALFTLSGGDNARLTFIKHFPDSFAERSQPLVADREIAVTVTPTVKPDAPGYDKKISGFSPEVLNTALELATEWGENFGKPITERILAKYPQLTESDIAELTKISREVEYFIYSLAERELAGEIRETDIPQLAIEKHPWLNRHNTARLTGIGMFYSRNKNAVFAKPAIQL